ncbi:MAG: hypothetical protein R3B90_06145 [Planctomycetaceae bacterium]
MDQLYEYLFLGGIALAVVGWLWLLVAAFRVSWKWGLGILLVPPVAVFFIIRHWRLAKPPIGIVLAGLVLAAAPAIYTRVAPIDLGPRQTVVDGETHITLTGWDQRNYQVLRQWPGVAVLQMANPDVTNDTLRLLEESSRLRELDISDSQVTDDGLAIVGKLPVLETLRLKNTAITDAGFRTHLLEHPTLLRLDVTGTKVSSELIREWRKANPQRRAMR